LQRSDKEEGSQQQLELIKWKKIKESLFVPSRAIIATPPPWMQKKEHINIRDKDSI
jgi:hypothetical protein